jgi:signal transduction histidine kinase
LNASYDVNDGLQSNEFNSDAYFKSADAELFFGGVNGFNRFDPATIKDDTQQPKVILSDFLLFNQSVGIKASKLLSASQQAIQDHNETVVFKLPGAINQLSQLTLNYQQNLITFEFAALHFANPLKNQYAYQLAGQDKQWVFTDANNRRATYTNLAAGDYTLRIKASNKDGYWNAQGKSLNITILPPPWQTWWAYTLYLLAFFALMGFGVMILTERRKHLNERQLNSQLKQVDKLKGEFLVNTSHELRTPLNGIIGLSESLMDGMAGKLPHQANQQLALVASSGRRLFNLVNDILDFTQLREQRLTLQRQPVNLHTLTTTVLAMLRYLIADKQRPLSTKSQLTYPLLMLTKSACGKFYIIY